MQVDQVVDVVERAFGGNEYPGDAWLQGSREGEEPFDECGAFVGQTDWRALTPEFLDQHYVVLSFFSEAGFRFFMPAFLIADLRDRLRTADPVFHLVGGFSDFSVTHRVGGRDFVIRSGSTQFINPRRYGASRFIDYARQRLSVFCREEAAAIVTYLEHVMSMPSRGTDRPAIEAGLKDYWRDRAQSAPVAAELRRYLDEQAAYLDAVMRDRGSAS
jgi:hypothetical protein